MPERAAGILVPLAMFVAAAPAVAATPIDRVPSAMPPAGFRITGCCVFRPARAGHGLISQQKAIAIARAEVDAKKWQKPELLLAKISGPVTFGFTTKIRTLRNPTTWVITFTSRKPVHIGIGTRGAGPPMRHYTIALDAKSGEFIRGFYTA